MKKIWEKGRGKHYDISYLRARDPGIIWVWSLHLLRFTDVNRNIARDLFA